MRAFRRFASFLRHNATSAKFSSRVVQILKPSTLRAFARTAAASGMVMTAPSVLCLADKKDKTIANDKNVATAIKTADEFYKKQEHSKIKKEVPKKEKQALVDKAFATIKKAIEKGEDISSVHKWYGIILNKVGESQGTKASIQNSFIVKDHWEKATALDPRDATSSSLLGEWCFSVAGLSSFTRTLASAIFASPPSATYTEALRHFMEAEAKEPGFWNKNRLMIAKCYIALAQPDEARRWLDSVLKAPVKTAEDADVAKEAAELAAKLSK